jgi:hypothetical protein
VKHNVLLQYYNSVSGLLAFTVTAVRRAPTLNREIVRRWHLAVFGSRLETKNAGATKSMSTLVAKR